MNSNKTSAIINEKIHEIAKAFWDVLIERKKILEETTEEFDDLIFNSWNEIIHSDIFALEFSKALANKIITDLDIDSWIFHGKHVDLLEQIDKKVKTKLLKLLENI